MSSQRRKRHRSHRPLPPLPQRKELHLESIIIRTKHLHIHRTTTILERSVFLIVTIAIVWVLTRLAPLL